MTPLPGSGAQWDVLHKTEGFAPRYPVDTVVRWLFRNFARARAGDFRLLDAGCGGGRHALLFAREGYSVEACDLTTAGLDILADAAKAAGYAVPACTADVDALPYADASFDGILSWGVIYYLQPHRYEKAVQEMARLLKPGGRVLMMVKSDADVRAQHAERLGDHRYRITGSPPGMPWENEVGMELTLLPHEALHRLAAGFSEVSIERCRVTLANGRYAEDDWHVYLRK